MRFRLLISLSLLLILAPIFSAFASPCSENLAAPSTPKIDVAHLPWVEFPKEFPLKASDLDSLFEAAYGDRAMASENYVVLTQGEFNRLVRAVKEGGLAKFELAPLDSAQTSLLRRVPGFLLVPALAGIKQKKVDISSAIRGLTDFFRYARNNGLLFEQNMRPSQLSANPLFTRATQVMLGRLTVQTTANLRFRLNPFEDLRPQSLGSQLKDLLSGAVGSIGHYLGFPNLIEFNLYMKSNFIRILSDRAWFWSEMNGVILHEGVHALTSAAGMDFVHVAQLVRYIAAQDAAQMDKLDTLELFTENTSALIP